MKLPILWTILCCLINIYCLQGQCNNDYPIEKTISTNILNQLKRNQGLLPDQAPFLCVVEDLPNRNFAIAMAEASYIYLDIDTYRECVNMGESFENGLAFILAHELSHFVRKHTDRHRFLDKIENDMLSELFVDPDSISMDSISMDPVRTDSLATKPDDNPLDIAIERDTLNEAQKDSLYRQKLENLKKEFLLISEKYNVRKNEVEADMDAGFVSYLAGYTSLDAGSEFLERAYNKYNLNKEGELYVSLEERKLIVRNVAMKLDSLMPVYDMANYATLVGERALALEAYEYVSESFQTVDLYNNMGVLSLLEVSAFFEIEDMPYTLPIIMDINLGDDTNTRGFDFTEEERNTLYAEYSQLLEKAIRYFDKALDLNPTYHTAHINKSVAYFLKRQLKKKLEIDYEFMDDDILFSSTSLIKARKILTKMDTSNVSDLSKIYSMLAILIMQREG